ncbi:ribonuclease III, partial [Klebsiella pneumoniae]|nr:ribonuclease III [Klebsiella pneumoniae]
MDNITKLLKHIRVKSDHLELYELALTHPSYNMDAKTTHQDYERLEYMGDAVLGYVAAD